MSSSLDQLKLQAEATTQGQGSLVPAYTVMPRNLATLTSVDIWPWLMSEYLSTETHIASGCFNHYLRQDM
jgi:hypothetical protein